MHPLTKTWFHLWQTGDYQQLPITEDFTHTSPFGTIKGKQAYLDLVAANEDKFLGQTFEIHEVMHDDERAVVRYTAKQGDDFSLDVCEWQYFRDGLIWRVVAYYHIGEVKQERRLANN